jgi:CDP-diacylglycerol--serine O-phosphatidyltransferase
MVFLIFAGVCDLFDGKFANSFERTEEEKAFGIQIDSLADMINFVAAPIILSLCLGLSQWYHLIIYSFYALAGITRLAYFNIAAESDRNAPLKYYTGLPVTFAALIFPVAWLLSWWLPTGVFNAVYALIFTTVAVLFISNFKIKKPRGTAYVFFILLAAVLTGLILIMGA